MAGADPGGRTDEGVVGTDTTDSTERSVAETSDPSTDVTTGDPRLYAEATRVVSTATGDAVVVGVVHDHPASVYRARRVVEAVAPDVVAVELPPLALGLFELLPPSSGDPATVADSTDDEADRPNEMSAALAAADGARTVGIDGIDGGFVRRLTGLLRRENASLGTVGGVTRAILGVGRQTLACGVAAARDEVPGRDQIPRGGADYGSVAADPPAVQADDERRHRSRSRSLLRAIERPHADRLLDAAREDAMVHRIGRLLDDGDVVAVVGFEHLEAVADGLRAERGNERENR